MSSLRSDAQKSPQNNNKLPYLMTTISRNKIDRQLFVVVIGCPMFPNQIVSFFAVAILHRLVKFLAPRRAPVGSVDQCHEFSRFSCLHLRRVFLQLLLRQSGRWGGSKKNMVKRSLVLAKAKGPCLLKIETCWIWMNIWLNGKNLHVFWKKNCTHNRIFFGHCYYISIMKMVTAFLSSIQRGKEKRLQDWNLLAVWLASKWQTGYWPAMTTAFQSFKKNPPQRFFSCKHNRHSVILDFCIPIRFPPGTNQRIVEVAKNLVVGGWFFGDGGFLCLKTGPGPWGPRIWNPPWTHSNRGFRKVMPCVLQWLLLAVEAR